MADVMRYSQDDVQQILQRAIARQLQDQDQLSRAQLLEIGEELGIDAAELELAELEWQSDQGRRNHQKAFDRHRHQRFRRLVIRFLIFNGFLLLLDWMTGGLSWSRYLLAFGGLGLAFRARRTYLLGEEEYQRRFEGWLRKQRMKRSLDSVVNRLLPS